MAKIDSQFHGTPEEITDFIKDCVKLYKLYLVTIQLFPSFKAELYYEEENLDKLKVTNDIRLICVYRDKPDMSESSYLEFLKVNKDCLVVTLGKHKGDTLEESSLGSVTEDIDSLKLYRKIIKNFNSMTITGAWVINPYNGAKEFYKYHRYTHLAKKLFEDGTKMIPLGGWNFYILNEEVDN
ncbi:hypothetical protein [Oceanirhabdus sp. W0125-5]|uniref:hypothetical protein n=1 Tax=Oceanirhabdus sp. W0125-5 TaxID=2999116 RepID=UPI0022F3300A|nr:hypothetical protein [Oceanirhabdus sp. W0125-5]WBW95241.1 hypothetical protein OW730_16280 [Oceanirhabdus sp. W0125-5]